MRFRNCSLFSSRLYNAQLMLEHFIYFVCQSILTANFNSAEFDVAIEIISYGQTRSLSLSSFIIFVFSLPLLARCLSSFARMDGSCCLYVNHFFSPLFRCCYESKTIFSRVLFTEFSVHSTIPSHFSLPRVHASPFFVRGFDAHFLRYSSPVVLTISPVC